MSQTLPTWDEDMELAGELYGAIAAEIGRGGRAAQVRLLAQALRDAERRGAEAALGAQAGAVEDVLAPADLHAGSPASEALGGYRERYADLEKALAAARAHLPGEGA